MSNTGDSKKKQTTKRVVSGIVSLLIFMSVFQSCHKKKETDDTIMTTTTSFNSFSSNDDSSYFHMDNQSTTSVTENVTERVEDDSDRKLELVNDDIYEVLVQAKDQYYRILYSQDSESEELYNNGVRANGLGELSSHIHILYDYIDKYISCYQKKQFDECYRYASLLIDYYPMFSKEKIYQMLVGSHLEAKYQSGLKRDEFGNVLYQFGNYCLENGKQVRFIGSSDEIVGDGLRDDSISKLKWIGKVPGLFGNQYSQLKNSDTDGVCYIANETMINSLCKSVTHQIIAEGAEEYQFDPTHVSIQTVGDQFVFVDDQGNPCGILSYDQSNRYNKVCVVRDGMASKSGDALLLDSFVSDLNKPNSSIIYHK